MTRQELQTGHSYFRYPDETPNGFALATRITMARFHVVAIAAGFLLAVSGPSFAAKRAVQKSDTKSTVESQSRAIKPNGPAIRSYSRDPDPYAYGVNWPKGS